MDNTKSLNTPKSLLERNNYFDNVEDVFSPVVKNQANFLSDTNSNPEILVDECSEQTSDCDEDLEHLKSNAYSYVPEGYEGHPSSDEEQLNMKGEENNNNTSKLNSQSGENLAYSKLAESFNSLKTRLGDYTADKTLQNVLEKNKSQYMDKLLNDEDDDLVKVPQLDFGNLKSQQSTKFNEPDSKSNLPNLKNVVTNLEKNLSSVRLEYQSSLSSSSLESSTLKKECRLPTAKSSSSDEKPATFENRTSRSFDMNKWLEEMPDRLKNFIEVEQLSSTSNTARNDSAPHKSHKVTVFSPSNRVLDRNYYYDNIRDPIKNATSPTNLPYDKQVFDTKSYMDDLKGELEGFKEDLKEELEGFKEDLKGGLEDLRGMYLEKKESFLQELYSKSPKMVQDFLRESQILDPNALNGENLAEGEGENDDESQKEGQEDELHVVNNPNVYYMETNRNTVRKAPDPDQQSSCKVYNIYEKFESFDISDRGDPKDEEEYEDRTNVQDDENIVKSISEYNMGFLSNFSRASEKCQLLKNEQVGKNLIKPWFVDPLNEKLTHGSKFADSAKNPDKDNKTKTNVVTKNNLKYVIDTGEKVKYTIKNTEPSKTENECKLINLSQIEKYLDNSAPDTNESERERVYDPILDFKKYKDAKKNSPNDTDWATFGRPLVKRTN